MLKLPTRYVALDLETNGLPKKGDFSEVEITELGFIEVNDGVIEAEYDVLCKPVDKDGVQLPLSAKIVEITGITDDLLEDKPPTIEVMAEVLPIIINDDLQRALIGSNIIGFDKPIIDKYCDLLGYDRIDEVRFIDTAALFKVYRRAHSEGHTNWDLPYSQDQFYVWAKEVLKFSWQKDKIKYNVDAALGYLAIPLFGVTGDRHRAVFDCKCCHLIMEKLREVLSL